MAKTRGAVKKKLLLNITTSDTRQSGYLFSEENFRREAGLQGDYIHQLGPLEGILESPLKELALASPCDSSLLGQHCSHSSMAGLCLPGGNAAGPISFLCHKQGVTSLGSPVGKLDVQGSCNLQKSSWLRLASHKTSL